MQVMMQDGYYDAEGREYRVRLIVQDAMGVKERTVEVYDMARTRPNFHLAFKGEQRLSAPHVWSKIDTYPGTNRPIPGGLRLLRADVTFFKNNLAAKLLIPPGDPGAWHLHSETTQLWARHMTAENTDEKGFWQCPDGKDNHGWDCSVYNLVAADVMGVRFWKKPEEKAEGVKRGAGEKGNKGQWLPEAKEGWLRR